MSGPYSTTVSSPESVDERFRAKYKVTPTGCHEWTAYVDPKGYGRFKVDGRMAMAHRVSFILKHGEAPADLEIDHLCRNRACVNPEHLEAVTKRENQRRSPISITGLEMARTTCPHGHSDYAMRCDGSRICRTCVNARKRASRSRLSGTAA